MRITRLELKNIGVFEHEVFDFDRETPADKAEIHIITGINGSGKSTILYSLTTIVDRGSIMKRFRFNDGIKSWLKLSLDVQPNIYFNL